MNIAPLSSEYISFFFIWLVYRFRIWDNLITKLDLNNISNILRRIGITLFKKNSCCIKLNAHHMRSLRYRWDLLPIKESIYYHQLELNLLTGEVYWTCYRGRSASFRKKLYALSCLSPYQKRWTKTFWRNLQVSLLAIPVMYRTSILSLAMFDIIRQYTEIKLSYPCPRLAKIKTINSGSRHRKVLAKKWHVADVTEWISHYSSSSESAL